MYPNQFPFPNQVGVNGCCDGGFGGGGAQYPAAAVPYGYVCGPQAYPAAPGPAAFPNAMGGMVPLAYSNAATYGNPASVGQYGYGGGGVALMPEAPPNCGIGGPGIPQVQLIGPQCSPIAPTCPSVFYPTINCDSNGLSLPPVNPCDPLSIFGSLFARRRGLRRTVLGIGPVTLGPGFFPGGVVPPPGQTTPSVATIIVNTPGPIFRGRSLRIPSNIAANEGLVIVGLTVNGVQQFDGEVPAQLFDEVSETDQMCMDNAGFGGQVALTVKNTSAQSVVFRAAIWGERFDF